MYKILKAEKLAANIYLMDVEAPRVARHCEPGQFVIVKTPMPFARIAASRLYISSKDSTATSSYVS